MTFLLRISKGYWSNYASEWLDSATELADAWNDFPAIEEVRASLGADVAREFIVYILDANTWIYFFKGLGNVSKNLLSKSPREIGIPSVVVFELEYGIAKSTSPNKRMQQLNKLCSLISMLPFSEIEAKAAAAIRVELERKGTPIGHYAVLIAGTAFHHNEVLVTNNTNEFKRIWKLMIGFEVPKT